MTPTTAPRAATTLRVIPLAASGRGGCRLVRPGRLELAGALLGGLDLGATLVQRSIDAAVAVHLVDFVRLDRLLRLVIPVERRRHRHRGQDLGRRRLGPLIVDQTLATHQGDVRCM